MRLGETSDPKSLIPGDPDAVDHNADALQNVARKMEGVGDELKDVDFGEWSGAASDSFQQSFSKEPVKWIKCADGAEKAGKALADYSSVLRWAQEQAAEAIDTWEQGTQAGEAGGAPSAAEPLHTEAQAILKRAKDQLELEGGRVAKLIGGQDGDAALALVLDAVEGVSTGGSAETSGPAATASASADSSGGVSKAEAQARAQWVGAQAEGSVNSQWGSARGGAQASVDAAATASASASRSSVQGAVEASAGARASAEGRASSGPAEAQGKVEGLAGATAGANGKFGLSGVEGNAEAYAGAKASAEGSADVGGIGVTGSAEGWAGAGAKAGVELGTDEEGNFKVETSLGAAVGLGGSASVGIEVDPDKVMDTAGDAASAVGDAWNGAGDSVQQMMSGQL
ncbi:hypothetical protein IQ251_14485 [Saccharopolyspora sp. HNM0983]|uniref:Putative T7SS secretion signal domain-containing protein n=1 Tax=Saccharopolyspora montiporae TaxID=2781240 RepID=A0A929BDS9_9PSEU|nr:hypothetical protein [Saccharopolyspora sp. HNM0983]MBE9375657.1 hypothetical protein [Saccharopolyspora sp. HNM0983]